MATTIGGLKEVFTKKYYFGNGNGWLHSALCYFIIAMVFRLIWRFADFGQKETVTENVVGIAILLVVSCIAGYVIGDRIEWFQAKYLHSPWESITDKFATAIGAVPAVIHFVLFGTMSIWISIIGIVLCVIYWTTKKYI